MLQRAIERGCLPYIFGEKTEGEAMRSAGLNHIRPLPIGLVPGDHDPFWAGGFPISVVAHIGRGSCNVHMKGRAIAAYRAATEAALKRRFGAGMAEDGRAGYEAVVPGQVTGCRDGVRYTYYREPKLSGFTVETYRVADCARDPLRGAG